MSLLNLCAYSFDCCWYFVQSLFLFPYNPSFRRRHFFPTQEHHAVPPTAHAVPLAAVAPHAVCPLLPGLFWKDKVKKRKVKKRKVIKKRGKKEKGKQRQGRRPGLFALGVRLPLLARRAPLPDVSYQDTSFLLGTIFPPPASPRSALSFSLLFSFYLCGSYSREREYLFLLEYPCTFGKSVCRNLLFEILCVHIISF